ncbi:MAG: ArnT family glycosyltransferase [Planctomycetota bacterium]
MQASVPGLLETRAAGPASPEGPAGSLAWQPSRRLVVIGFVLIAMACLLFQGSRGLWRPDEGRYTAVAMQMLRSGDWMTPRLNSEVLHLTKPPLAYWAIAASISVFGRNEWAVRLPNTLAFLATILLVAAVGRALLDGASSGDPRPSPRAWIAALIYGTSAIPFAAANIVTTDTILTLWETLAMFAFVRWRLAGSESRPRGLLVLMWTAFGLACATKGPPGLLPLAAMLIFGLWTEGLRSLRRLWSWPGLAIFLLLGFGWFVWIGLTRHGTLHYFLHREFMSRIFSGKHHRHSEWWGAAFVYAPTLIAGTLPWSWRLLWIRPSRLASLAGPRGLGARLLGCWFLLPLLVFCVARSRLPFYILPLFVPLSVMLAASMRLDARSARRFVILLSLWLLLLVAVKGKVTGVMHRRSPLPLVAAIERSIGSRPEKIVFVNSPVHYSLSLYFDCEVKETVLRFRPTVDADLHRIASVEEEILEHGAGRVYVVRAAFEKELVSCAEEHGVRMLESGKLADLRILTVAGG